MPDTNQIDALSIEIEATSENAAEYVERLGKALADLKTYAKGGAGLRSVTNQLRNIKEGSVSSSQIENLKNLARTLSSLSEIRKSSGLASTVNTLKKIPELTASISNVDLEKFSTQMEHLSTVLTPLEKIPKSSGLASTLNTLKKLPELTKNLDKVDLGKFTKQMEQLATAIHPLADEMQKVSNGFANFPKAVQTASKYAGAANKTATGISRSTLRLGVFALTAKKVVDKISGFVTKSNAYVENVNLFTVAMGDYANKAREYAEYVGDAMGIDPGEWMRAQGVFMTLGTGFGVLEDRAALMSKNLTQLGYDISSFYNTTVEDAINKLQSGFSGELEPLRRLGYDLSQAKLMATAASLGIDKAVSSMTQAEKAELRYVAIMTQVTQVQGDMARTLESPANQLRIFKAATEQASRALGNIFIPHLNKVLPYATALANTVRWAANEIATLVGFSLPEVEMPDSSALPEDIEQANDEAKKLKRQLLGIDELNILSDNSGEGIGGGTGFDFDLGKYSYDFIGEGLSNKVNEITDQWKAKLSPFFDWIKENFNTVKTTAIGIGTVLAAWTLTEGVTSTISGISKLASSDAGYAVSLALTVAGITLMTDTAYDIGYAAGKTNGKDWLEFAGQGLAAALGGAWLGAKIGGVQGAVVGGTIALGVGLAVSFFAYIKGKTGRKFDDWFNGPDGETWRNLKAELQEAEELTKEILVDVQAKVENLSAPITEIETARSLIEEIFTLDGIKIKTPEEIEILKTKIDALNDLKLEGIQVEFNDLTLEVTSSKEALLEQLDALEKEMRLEAGREVLKDLWQQEIEAKIKAGSVLEDYEAKQEEILELEKKVNDYLKEYRDLTREQELTALTDDAEATARLAERMQELEAAAPDFARWNEELGYQRKALEELTPEYESTKENLKGIADQISAAESIVYGLGDAMRDTVKEINDETAKIKPINIQMNTTSTIADIISSWQSGTFIPQYADGGFPEQGEMFIARERGPELVGRIGHSTAVANNDQIVSGIASANEGVINAVYAMASMIVKAVEDKDSNVYLGGKQLARELAPYSAEVARGKGTSLVRRG